MEKGRDQWVAAGACVGTMVPIALMLSQDTSRNLFFLSFKMFEWRPFCRNPFQKPNSKRDSIHTV